MNKVMLTELLVFMVTSAAGLPGEPKSYGPLRLIDSAWRLAAIMLAEDPENPALQELISMIDTHRQENMTDPEAFVRMLNDAAACCVDLTGF